MMPFLEDATWSLTYFSAMFIGFLYAFVFWIVQVVVEQVAEQQQALRKAGEPITSWLGRIIAIVPSRLTAMLALTPFMVLPFIAIWSTLPRPYSSDAILGGLTAIPLSGMAQQILYNIIVRRERRKSAQVELNSKKGRKG